MAGTARPMPVGISRNGSSNSATRRRGHRRSTARRNRQASISAPAIIGTRTPKRATTQPLARFDTRKPPVSGRNASPACKRRIAQHALQIQAQHEHHAVVGQIHADAEHHRRAEACACGTAPSGSIGAALRRFDDDEQRRRAPARAASRPITSGWPMPSGRNSIIAPTKRGERDDRQQLAGQVDAAARALRAAVCSAIQSKVATMPAAHKRQVDPEDAAPAERRDQQAADHRPRRDRYRARRRPQSDGARPQASDRGRTTD